jgi:hypothetical protein
MRSFARRRDVSVMCYVLVVLNRGYGIGASKKKNLRPASLATSIESGVCGDNCVCAAA